MAAALSKQKCEWPYQTFNLARRGDGVEISAAVVRAPGTPFRLETLELDEPRGNGIRGRIVATGLCHTDLVVRDQLVPTPLPAVLGQEGSGIVEAVGAAVTDFAVGDPVVLSFTVCRSCPPCESGEPAYCTSFAALNFGGCRDDGLKHCAIMRERFRATASGNRRSPRTFWFQPKMR
jgi:Zn-dependent alcohol dehydrogenase